MIAFVASLIRQTCVAFVAPSMISGYSEVSAQTVKKAKQKSEIKGVTFNVHLHCAGCVKKVQENIAFEKGVKDLKVSLEEGTVYIKYDSSKTSEETLAAAMKKLGYEVIHESKALYKAIISDPATKKGIRVTCYFGASQVQPISA